MNSKFTLLNKRIIGWMMMFLIIGMPSLSWGNDFWKNGETPSHGDWESLKRPLDDPRPFLKGPGGDPKTFVPPDMLNKVTFEVADMEKTWAKTVGFKSPDVTGKIHPEIKPGIYDHTDKDKHPGLKALMIPNLYDKFMPGAPPHAGNFSEMEVVPTRQYYWASPIARASLDNEGKTRLDDQGYFIQDSYSAGYPFPKPAGPFKAEQIINNWYKKYLDGENNTALVQQYGWNKHLTMDWDSKFLTLQVRFAGRVLEEPMGFIDSRAQKKGEDRQFVTKFITPQDSAGNVQSILYYGDINKKNAVYVYFNLIRRLRKFSAEDTQDPFPGFDAIFDDDHGFGQKLRPDLYPYDNKVIAEREYLFPSYTLDGSVYMDSTSGYELRNMKWERRPVYVVELTQRDPNYIYGKRVLYFDQETFMLLFAEAYDQKGRLYRDYLNQFAFLPEQGMFMWWSALPKDHIDLHSSYATFWMHPYAWWVGRDQTGIGQLMRMGR